MKKLRIHLKARPNSIKETSGSPKVPIDADKAGSSVQQFLTGVCSTALVSFGSARHQTMKAEGPARGLLYTHQKFGEDRASALRTTKVSGRDNHS